MAQIPRNLLITIELITIEALEHWLKCVRLSREDRAVLNRPLILHYAKAYDSEGYFRHASDRGVLDVELRLVVPSLIDWEDGNIEPFLRSFPSLCALIASGQMPKVMCVKLSPISR